jgi:V8-like Glu-specific endopeptidase
MSETSKTSVPEDVPSLPDDLVHREDVPGTGTWPDELADLARANYLYLHAKGTTAPKLDLEQVLGDRNLSAWRVALGSYVAEGAPGHMLEQIRTKDIELEPEDIASQEALRPDWATLAFNPRLATPRPENFLRRRSGRAVRPDFVIWDPNDDRQVIFPSNWPWFLAGRIDVWKFGSYWKGGTGALVGKRVVLTASHMVPWGAGPGNWAMKFTPGYFDGQSTLGGSVFSYVEKARGYSDHDQGDDMAILKLYTPLGNSLGYFGYKTYNDDWEGGAYWILIGYPGAVAGGQRPSRQSGIVILDDDSDGAGVELEHNGDTTSGNSGGPLWSWWGDSPRVIGTHSGSEYNWDEDNNVAAGGSALSALIKWGRDNW